MENRDFRSALAVADRLMEKTGLPTAAEERLRRRLLGQGQVVRRAPLLAFGFALGCAAVIAFVVARPRPATEVVSQPVTPAPSDGIAIETSSPSAVVKRQPDGLRLVQGRIVVAVGKRAAGLPPARVLVSGGAIEVMGTRFTVVQDGPRGQVTLHEGAIRFVATDGVVTDLAPGQSVRWPAVKEVRMVRPAPVASKRLAGKAPTRPAAPEMEPLESLLQRLAVMRSRARHDEAAVVLIHALERPYPAVARERLSYELGSLLTHQIADRARACTHWQRHLQTFGRGRYAREVQQATQALGCRAQQ